MNFNNLEEEYKINDKSYFEVFFQTTTSAVIDLMVTEEYKIQINAKRTLSSSYSSKGVFFKIGRFHIHLSNNQRFRVYIEAILPDYYSPNTNHEGVMQLLYTLFDIIGLSREVTFQLDIMNESDKSGILNREDLLY